MSNPSDQKPKFNVVRQAGEEGQDQKNAAGGDYGVFGVSVHFSLLLRPVCPPGRGG